MYKQEAESVRKVVVSEKSRVPGPAGCRQVGKRLHRTIECVAVET